MIGNLNLIINKWSSEPTIKNEAEPKSHKSKKNLNFLIMKKTIFKTAVLLLTAIMTISCSKDGATGATGATGPAGANGTNGNANVIGTNTLTVTNWTSNTSGSFWATGLSAPGITQAIVDKGIVSVFISDTSGGWMAMPYTYGNVSWYYGFGVGFVNIYKTNTNFISMANPGSQTFRVVIISASNRMANPNTDWKDYEQVKEALNLQD